MGDAINLAVEAKIATLPKSEAVPSGRKGTGKAITGQERESVTTKAIDNAPETVIDGLTDDTVLDAAQRLEARLPAKVSASTGELTAGKGATFVKFANRAASHSREALSTLLLAGKSVCKQVMAGDAKPVTARSEWALVLKEKIAYVEALDAACFGGTARSMPAPRGKAVAASRKGTAQGSPSRGHGGYRTGANRTPKQLANDKRLGEAARARFAASKKNS
jgi:hypothetical protein